MKKILLVAALFSLAGVAMAGDNVEVYGKLQEYVDSYKLGTAGAVTQGFNDSSRFGVRGSEDLGAGLKATYIIETNINAETPGTASHTTAAAPTALGDRESRVGLSNKFFSIDLGHGKQVVGSTLDKFDAFNNYDLSVTNVVHSTQGQRINNAVFASATPVEGVTVLFQQAESNTTVKATQAAGVELAKFGATLAVNRFDNHAGNATNQYAAKYTFAPTGTTVAAIYSNDTVANVKSVGESVGVTQVVPGVKALSVLAVYGKKDDKSVANNDLKAYALGANYSLSQRTTLQARYIKEDFRVATGDVRHIAVGLQHNF